MDKYTCILSDIYTNATMVVSQLASVSVAILLLVCSCSVSAEKSDLYFSFITALTGSPQSSGGIPVIDLALEQINNDSRLLPNYTLRYTEVLDSKCDTTTALESFLQHFDSASQPNYLTSMCCGCSSATIPVAEISHHWNVPHISFSSSAPLLSNRNRFKTFFHTLPCYVYEPQTIETIMSDFGWTRMAVINQDESPLDSVANDLRVIFDSNNWDLHEAGFIKQASKMAEVDYSEILTMAEDYRVIMINTFEDHTYHILCEAYQRFGHRLLDQEIVLIMHGRYMTKWWETAHENVASSCTRQQVMSALNRTFALTPETYDLIENTSTISYSGITPLDFTNKYLDLLQEPRYSNYTPLNFFGSAYDAMWVVAYGLDLADKWVRNGTTLSECEDLDGELVMLEQFTYTNQKMGCYLTRAFHEVNILGITGPVEFREDGARPDNVVRLRQNRVYKQGTEYVVSRPTVARVTNRGSVEDVASESIVRVRYTQGESESTIWPDGVIPHDGSSQRVLDNTHTAVQVILYMLGVLGLIFVIAALIFNLVFRNKRVIKLGSPNLNFLIIGGATLLYLSLFFYAASVHHFSQVLEETILCNFRFWLFSVGNTLCFAVILAKQWRIYYIFSNPTPKKKAIKDWMLLIMVAIIVGLEMVVLLIGTAIPMSRLTANATRVQENRQNSNTGRNEQVFVFVCVNTAATVWIAISFGYKALLQLGAIFMAFTTRKVKVKGLNDTKELYTIIYINTVILTMLLVTEFALRGHRDVYVTLYGLAIFAGATLFLGLTFVPKAVLLHNDPNGEKVFSERDTHFTQENETVDSLTVPQIQAKIAQLQQHLARLEKDQSIVHKN